MLRLTAFALLASLATTGAALAEAGDGKALLARQETDRKNTREEGPAGSGELRLARVALAREVAEPVAAPRRIDFFLPWQTGVYQ